MQAAIEARAVGLRTRAGEVAVRDISLTVDHGELVAITGGGQGRTTLLDAMSGLRPPTSGSVIRCTGPAAGPPPARPTGYVPADDMMHAVLPLATALGYAAALRSTAAPQSAATSRATAAPQSAAVSRSTAPPRSGLAAQAADEALSVAGLAGRAGVLVGDLDPGERKRAAAAAELLSRPAQLFLDEPTAGLDPAQAAEVLRMLRRLTESGITVVFTTGSPLDAARCDKVAVLAAGGDLVFFGTPEAARGYFGADSLEEIYERLAGLGDPAAAWSRRFFAFSHTRAGFSPVPTTPPAPGPAFLVPDSAGPHSAGRVTVPADWTDGGRAADLVPAARDGQAQAVTPAENLADTDSAGAEPARDRAGHGASVAAPVRQLFILVRRNTEIGRRSALARAVLAAAPAAVLLAFAALIGAGAFDAPGASRAWPVLGGFCIGLSYGLPQVRGELGVLRAERFGGLSATAYVLAKLAVLLPALAVAGAAALAVPAALGRLPHGYGPVYLTLLLSSALALALALLLSAAALLPATALPPSTAQPPSVLRFTLPAPPPAPGTARPAPAAVAFWLPALLLAGAVCTLLDRPVWPDWLALGVLTLALATAATVVIARRVPVAWRDRQAVRF